MIDRAKGPWVTADGSSKVQMKTPNLAPSTLVNVSTYPNVLPIAMSAPRNVKFLLPFFVTSATGKTPKGSFQPFFNVLDTTQMTRPTEQKRLLDEALKWKQPSEADLIQKICHELAAEAAVNGRRDSQQNVPGCPEKTPGSASQPLPQSQPSQNQQTTSSNGRVEELPDHGQPPPFYHDYFAPRGNLSDGIY